MDLPGSHPGCLQSLVWGASSLAPPVRPPQGAEAPYPGLLVLLVELSQVEVLQVDQQAFLAHLTGLHSAEVCP